LIVEYHGNNINVEERRGHHNIEVAPECITTTQKIYERSWMRVKRYD